MSKDEEKKNEREWVELGQRIYDLVELKQTDGEEFQAYVRLWGIEKLRQLYRNERTRRKVGKSA